MRTLHLLHQYLPEHVGGVELNVQAISRGLAALGMPTALFYRASGEGSGYAPREEAGVLCFRAWQGQPTPTGRFMATFRPDPLLESFERVVGDFHPDLVHIHHLMGLPAAIGHVLIERQIPYLVTLHDYWWPCANAQLLTNDTGEPCAGPRAWVNCGRCALARAGMPLWGAPLVAPLFAYRHRLLDPILSRAAAVTAPTRFAAATYRQLGYTLRDVAIVPPGIALPIPLPPRGPSEPGRLRVAYVGGIAPQKGVHTLVQAVKPLVGSGVSLDVWGDLEAFPDYAAELQQAAPPQITFHGRADNHLIPAAMAAADLLVVPSLWYETAALVIQEAFAVGTPVIASEIGALRERVRDGVDGLHFPPGDVEALRTHLRALRDDPQRLARFRAAIAPPRTVDEQVNDFVALYRRILAR